MNEINIRDKEGCRLGLIGARKNMGLTQQKLAERANISRSLLAQLELGLCNASDDIWKALKRETFVRSVEEIWEKYTYVDGYFIGDDGSRIRDKAYFRDKKNT